MKYYQKYLFWCFSCVSSVKHATVPNLNKIIKNNRYVPIHNWVLLNILLSINIFIKTCLN